MKQFHIIYKTTNHINNKIYVGMHSTYNLDDGYMGSGTLLRKAVAKYGEDNFSTQILHSLPDRKSLIEMEREIVDKLFVARDDTYNIVIGGGGSTLSSNRVYKTNLEYKFHKRLAKLNLSYNSFINTVLEFSIYDAIINEEAGEHLDECTYHMIKALAPDNFKYNSEKKNKYKQHQSEIKRFIQYVTYGI